MSAGSQGIPEPVIDGTVLDGEACKPEPSPSQPLTSSMAGGGIENEGPGTPLGPPHRTVTTLSMDSQWHDGETLIEMKLLPEAETGLLTTPANRGRSTTVDVHKLQKLQKQFSSRKQLRKLLLEGLARWAITAVLILLLYVTLLHFSGKAVMSKAKKLQFNAFITGLSIALGLSIAGSLKEMALEIRWWILSRRKRSLHEVDLILHMDSPTHVFRLLLAHPRLKVIIAFSFWLALNLGAQVCVALLGLTYSVDSAVDSALTVRGNVSIPDLRELATEKVLSGSTSKSKSISALQYTANSFGTLSLSLGYADISDKPKPRMLSSQDTNLIFAGPDYVQYLYYESSPDFADDPNGLQITTNRTSNSTGVCASWPVIDGGDGSSFNISYLNGPSGEKKYVSIPIAGGLNQTTFVTRPSKTCGEGCGRIYALEASATQPFFYSCNITVGQVENAIRQEHQLGADLRNMAANAIALQGYAASSLTKDPDLQYQTYPAESIYGSPQIGNASTMAILMAQFAIGVVAVAAQDNPQLIIPGDQPVAGVVLNINNWKYVHLILGLTGGTQLILFLITTFVANRVFVKDKSYLAISKLLEPTIGKLGPSGNLATGREISDIFGDEEKFIYGVERAPQSGMLRLAVGQQKATPRFSEGIYE